MPLFSKKPITGATGTDLLRAASGKKWSEVLRILEGSTIDRQSLDNSLLMAVMARKRKIAAALMDAGAKADAMNGRMLREAAANADTRMIRTLFAHQPQIARFAESARGHVYAQWADIPGGDGAPYRETLELLEKLNEKRTVVLARARRKPAPRI